MPQNEMVIFTKTSDFLAWLLPHTNHFPKAHRHSFSQRLLNAAFDLREFLEEANLRQGEARLERLALADEAMARIRIYLRLATKWKWQSEAQYEHCALMLSEIGRLLGGWQRATR
jgi:23S rRNA-intervening sequence protein